MVSNDKILKALESATNYLEKSISSLSKGDKSSFEKYFWHVAAELEYALFMLSLTFQEENLDKSKLKSNPDIKSYDAYNVLVEIHELLDNAKRLLSNCELLDAYKSVYAARHNVFAVNEFFAKKRRGRLKQ